MLARVDRPILRSTKDAGGSRREPIARRDAPTIAITSALHRHLMHDAQQTPVPTTCRASAQSTRALGRIRPQEVRAGTGGGGDAALKRRVVDMIRRTAEMDEGRVLDHADGDGMGGGVLLFGTYS